MSGSMESIVKYLPVLAPVIVLEFGLMIGALVHLLRRKAVRRGSVGLWAAVIIVIGIIGPALYFLIGREED
jgi:4-amino-4-deoxy-L-arabinose transferase-like glycosyltransferase